MKKILTVRVWILIIALFLAVLAISPRPWAKGIEIKSVREGSEASKYNIKPGENLLSVNGKSVATIKDYLDKISELEFTPVKVSLKTDQGSAEYSTTGNLGFLYENQTITSIDEPLKNSSIKKGAKIFSINNIPINYDEDLINLTNKLFPKKPLVIKTDKTEYAMLLSKEPDIIIGEAKKSNIKRGLDLSGGTRVLLKPISDQKITDQTISDIIAVLERRLNVYGLADLRMRPASDLEGNRFILIEIAGVSREEVRDLIAKQGKFEAKIGDETAFVGGKGDIPFVCRNDGSCSGIIPPCSKITEEQYSCRFQFAIGLSEEAAQRHADITGKLDVNTSAGGDYLSKPLDLYLDDQLVDSLRIDVDLKGSKTTRISITGPGLGPTEESAYENAVQQMNKLQTILITGSLPVKLEAVKLDTISPIIGQEFIKNSTILIIVAFLAVALIIFIRYRKLRIVLPMVFISLSEIVLTLGVAALIKWNLDLAGIAGIIAAVGTGIDDQVVITDEATGRGTQYLNWKDKIKRAFGIVFVAFFTTGASMIPLYFAGAGLIRGFAVTTIIGITIGVFITRPAYGHIIEALSKE